MQAASLSNVDLRRRALLGGTLAAGALLALPCPLRADEPAEPQVVDLDWDDTTRSRAVPVRLYWPQRPSSEAPVPLVVFSHGIGGSRLGYSYLGRHWAAQGWASLHLQHVGSDRALWFGNPLGLIGRLRDAARDSEAMDRALDLRFALDRLLDPAFQHPLLGRPAEAIDPQRIVAAGHSYGANTTLLAAGARVIRQDRPVDLREPRLRAAIVLSTPPFYGEGNLAAILEPVRLPTLHVTSLEDVILIPGYQSGVDDRIAVFDAVPDPRKLLVVFDRGSHSIFTDRIVSGGTELNTQVKSATKGLAVAFLRQVFDQDHTALKNWQAAWQPIVARTDGPGLVPVAPSPRRELAA
jgi:dienelactone hydrolase